MRRVICPEQENIAKNVQDNKFYKINRKSSKKCCSGQNKIEREMQQYLLNKAKERNLLTIPKEPLITPKYIAYTITSIIAYKKAINFMK